MDKKCKIVMLPIKEKAQNCLLLLRGKLSYHSQYFTQDYLSEFGAIAYHLYILSDDEVKNGDYVCPVNYQAVWAFQKAPCPMPYWGNEKTCKKIIATTNQTHDDYLNHLLPQPSRLFIDKYVVEYNKGNIINDVMVEYTYNNPEPDKNVLCLKVDPRDNTITIKKIKDSWTRDEVEALCWSAFVHNNHQMPIKQMKEKLIPEFKDWFEREIN